MKVKATAQGFFGAHLKNIGDEFEVPDGTKSPWWEATVTKKAVVTEEPVARSEVVKDKPAKKKLAKKKS